MTIDQYWRTRCELAEKCLNKPPLMHHLSLQWQADNQKYKQFLKDNPLGEYQVIGTAEMVPNEQSGMPQQLEDACKKAGLTMQEWGGKDG